MRNYKIFLTVLLFTLPITGLSKESKNSMNNEVEPIDYRLEVELNKCSADLLINGLLIFSYYDKEPMNTLIGVGEYLKPENNIIQFYSWPSNRDSDIFDSDSKCNFILKARNRFETPNLKSVITINYHPNDSIAYNTSVSALNVRLDNEQWGELLGRNSIIHNSKKEYYHYSQAFNIKKDYPTWNWVNSYQFSENKETIDSLPENHQLALINAYKEYWELLKNKNLEGLKKLHKELLNESVKANGGDNNNYFSSLGLDTFLNSADFQLLPLAFSQSRIELSLDGRVVSMSPSPLNFFDKENNSKFSINPKYRFDGKKFIITR
ncbi:hypothetical protein [Photorhabdus heterorhabditis]|uniref:hypothetical protein n=1 Tax=Photorhabdus heterorhabditis TaxID=880156 RepID=UPI001562364C|nr:hypothetical protein [Photorhabdus heterorhabditis]NRN30841.1 hypothetical protein [Photorhabdus heterorhabditis subsp. aluminescens]